jgi:hypothetical protein
MYTNLFVNYVFSEYGRNRKHMLPPSVKYISILMFNIYFQVSLKFRVRDNAVDHL